MCIPNWQFDNVTCQTSCKRKLIYFWLISCCNNSVYSSNCTLFNNPWHQTLEILLYLHIINYLCLLVSEQVTDAMLTHASFIYPENTPTTKEAYYYRTIFEKFFPKVRYKFYKKWRKGTWLHERNIFTHVIILAFLHFFIYYGVGKQFLYMLFSSTKKVNSIWWNYDGHATFFALMFYKSNLIKMEHCLFTRVWSICHFWTECC